MNTTTRYTFEGYVDHRFYRCEDTFSTRERAQGVADAFKNAIENPAWNNGNEFSDDCEAGCRHYDMMTERVDNNIRITAHVNVVPVEVAQ